jgi:hypothetical protein
MFSGASGALAEWLGGSSPIESDNACHHQFFSGDKSTLDAVPLREADNQVCL